MQQHNQYHLHIHTHIHMQFHAHMFYAILYMHYCICTMLIVHRSTYVVHRASYIACKSIYKSRVMCISQIVAIGASRCAATDRKAKLLPTIPCANRPQPRHIGQMPSQQYPMPNPRKTDATVIHTHELASCGIDSSRKAPQKWEDMVMRMQALEAKFGGDFELRASNCWRNLEAIREKKGPGISPEALSLAVFLQPFKKLIFCGKLDAPPVVHPENRCALRDLNFHVLSSFEDIIPYPGQLVNPYFQKIPASRR